MYKEPWSDIAEYPDSHREALEQELQKEISGDHVLFGLSSRVIAQREDRDDILVKNKSGYFIVHLTWSGKAESNIFPATEQFETLEKLKIKLVSDSEFF